MRTMPPLRDGLVFALLCGSATATKTQTAMQMHANPIRRVVNLLQLMQKKIEKEAASDEKLFEKFMCYCDSGAKKLSDDVEEAKVKIPQLESGIEEAVSMQVQLKNDLKAHKADRTETKEATEEATAIREKEAAEYSKYKSEAETNIAAMAKAIGAIKKGLGAAFLQTSAADVLRNIITGEGTNIDLTDSDRDDITSFLQNGDAAPGSHEIIGILSQMKETMEKEFQDTTSDENDAIEQFGKMIAAKTKQVNVLTEMIETKTERLGEVGVEIVNMKDNLEDTKKGFGEDTVFLANLDTMCVTKKAEWEIVEKTRTQETLALADTIKLLNDDDALELFKKALPSASLLQVQVTSKAMLTEARAVIASARKHHRSQHLDLIALAMHSKTANFDKIMKLIDDMVALMNKEQGADDAKKEQCAKDLDEAEDEKKEIAHTLGNMEKSIADLKARLETVSDEVKGLENTIAILDKEVAENTAQRKDEHQTYVSNMAANQATEQLLEMAKNRLNKFYNPKLHKAPPKRELSEADQITLNNGGTLAPTAAPGGIAGTGITALQEEGGESFLQLASQDPPPPPPEANFAYQKKSEGSSGVLQMLETLKKDIQLEMVEMETEEKDGQKDYEDFIKDSAEKRQSCAKSITEKESARSEAESALTETTQAHKGKTTEMMNTDKIIMDLHGDCDWLLKNFDVRKTARAGEVDSLNKAKAILSGADYSLVQTGAKHHLRRVHHH